MAYTKLPAGTPGSVGTTQLADSSVTSPKIADGAIVDADVSASAAIAYSKLAALTSAHILVGNGSNVATDVAVSGDATLANTGAVTVANSAVIGKVLTGYTSGAGTVAATDTILQAIQKLNGNDATNANLTGPITSVGNATAIASQTGTGTKFVMDTSPTLVTPILGTPSSGTLTNCTGLPQTGIGATVYVRADTPTSTITSSLSDITTWTERTDTNNAFNPSTGVFTAPSTGIYAITAAFYCAGTYVLNSAIQLAVNVNGSDVYDTAVSTAALGASAQGTTIDLNLAVSANDTIKLRILNNSTGPSFNGGAALNWLTIVKIGN